IFNRYSHIALISEEKPSLLNADRVGVPVADFWTNRVEIPVNVKSTAIPIVLQQNQSAAGEFIWNGVGHISGVDVFIGNFFNSADGVLTLKLCNLNKCTSARRNLTESVDNEFLHFKPDQPLEINQQEPVRFEFELREGSHPVAVWTYKKTPSTPVTFVKDGQPMPSVPRFRIRYLPKINSSGH
ncbi:MAG: hypothetical protein ACXWTN_12075, partial [Methylosarcina sp.]